MERRILGLAKDYEEEELEALNTSNLKSFHYYSNGEVGYSTDTTLKSSNVLIPGSYNIFYKAYPVDKVVIEVDDYNESVKEYNFLNKERIIKILDAFFNEEVKLMIDKLGFYHRTGILFWGREGSGKSTIVRWIVNYLKQYNVLSLYVNTPKDFSYCWEMIKNIRKIQDCTILVILEEVDSFTNEDVNIMKRVMDGNLSINNCIFLGTTNSLDLIPNTIRNRPSRFRHIINIPEIEDTDVVYEIVHNILDEKFNDDEIKKIANGLVGNTIDMIKHACFDKIMDIPEYKNDIESKIGFNKQS